MKQFSRQKEWFETWFDSPYYHVLYDHRDEREAERFILKLKDRLPIRPTDRVLDLGCGAGRYAAFLADHAGFSVGLDLSRNSIRTARNQYDRNNLEFYKHDMRLPFRINYFDIIFNFFTSFGYFRKTSDNLRVLQSSYKGLHKGGCMLIDFMNAEKTIAELVAEERIVKQGITFDIRREVRDGKIMKHIRFEADGRPYDYTESVQALMPHDFRELAGRAGFRIGHIYGDYDLGTYDPAVSPRLILELRKPGE